MGNTGVVCLSMGHKFPVGKIRLRRSENRSSCSCNLLCGSWHIFSIPSSRAGQEKREDSALPINSIKVLLQPEVLSISLLSLIITFVDRFYILELRLLLNHSGSARTQ